MVEIDTETIAKGTRDALAKAEKWNRSVGRIYGYARAGIGLAGGVLSVALIWLFWTTLTGWWAAVPIAICSVLFLVSTIQVRAGLSKDYRASELAYDHVKTRLAPVAWVLKVAGWLGLSKRIPLDRPH